MTEEEGKELRRLADEYAVDAAVNWKAAAKSFDDLVDFVNAMLAKREGE